MFNTVFVRYEVRKLKISYNPKDYRAVKLTLYEIAKHLIHDYPQGTNPKPKTNKDGLEHARVLPAVQAAMQCRVLAVATNVFFRRPAWCTCSRLCCSTATTLFSCV